MKIAIIGTGRMGAGLLKTLYPVFKNELLFAGRDPVNTQMVIDHLAIPLYAINEWEAFEANVIIHTLWYRDVIPWVIRNREALKGKILIDIANPFNDTFDDLVLPYGFSAAEEIQKLLPETTVAGAFKNTFWTVFDAPVLQGIKSDVFLTADDPNVRQMLISAFSILPFRFLDAGPIANNRTIERMTLLSSYLGKKAGSYPNIAYNLWGLPHNLLPNG
ncbi:NADP oxidoreductase [Mucilaginibacter terrigena]|uniref:NADP oxidoreductase n=1 Tax=Mucilaginibacter terrigena TaxID=2492395 RepID=A0A4Q5LR31_9SPHI|nr:NAD(P)-binding domain-containing protein [Mucilaginibacter terrigena]RYU91915.1 NADP oxidoreductase [Mucilaginibacter terrigena]